MRDFVSIIIDPHACVFAACMMPISIMRLKFCDEQADSRSWMTYVSMMHVSMMHVSIMHLSMIHVSMMHLSMMHVAMMLVAMMLLSQCMFQ